MEREWIGRRGKEKGEERERERGGRGGEWVELGTGQVDESLNNTKHTAHG